MLIVGEENVLESLEELVIRGFCFHGSSRLIEDKLTPHLAVDDIKESGNRKAVYLTINPLLAMFTALCGGVDVGKRENKCFMAIEDGEVKYPEIPYFAVEKTENISDIGYIYVVDRKMAGLDEINGEILSYEPIEPMFAIKIKRGEFRYPINKILF